MSKIQTAFSAIFPTGNLRVQVVLWEFWNSTQFCFFFIQDQLLQPNIS